jgi:hypothetical protein
MASQSSLIAPCQEAKGASGSKFCGSAETTLNGHALRTNFGQFNPACGVTPRSDAQRRRCRRCIHPATRARANARKLDHSSYLGSSRSMMVRWFVVAGAAAVEHKAHESAASRRVNTMPRVIATSHLHDRVVFSPDPRGAAAVTRRLQVAGSGSPVAHVQSRQLESLTLRHPLACGLVVLITGRAYQGVLGGVHD